MSIANPRQTILVTTRSHHEVMGRILLKDNITATDWHSPISHSPLIYGIFLGADRVSVALIRQSKVFTVNFVGIQLEKAAQFCRIHHGHHMDKYEACGLHKEEASSIECGKIREALGYLECEVIFEQVFGDHVFFAGKVRQADIKNDGHRLIHMSKDIYTTTER